MNKKIFQVFYNLFYVFCLAFAWNDLDIYIWLEINFFSTVSTTSYDRDRYAFGVQFFLLGAIVKPDGGIKCSMNNSID